MLVINITYNGDQDPYFREYCTELPKCALPSNACCNMNILQGYLYF